MPINQNKSSNKYLLAEDGSFILLENNGDILLEQNDANWNMQSKNGTIWSDSNKSSMAVFNNQSKN